MSSAPPPPEDPYRYQPFQQYYEPQQPAPSPSPQRRGGFIGWLLTVAAAVWAVGKYALLFVGKFGALKTLITLLISFWFYALFFGPWFAAGLVVMILVHEMGHVIEIRRQGMQASAPLFIPFFGAAIFQRQHPTDALKQAQIGIAGPIAGTIGATAAFVLYGSTHSNVLLSWALIGFFINLFNLLPFGMLDGGWIMGAVSKWFQVLGLIALAGAVYFLGLNFVAIVVILFGIPTAIERFRNDQSPYYRSVPVRARLAMAAAWLFLTGYLAVATLAVNQLVRPFVG
jgi:Zn-dependent protease